MAEEKAKELDKKGSDILVGGGWKLLWSRGRSSALLAPPQHFHRRRWWPRRRERAREGAALLSLCLLSAFLPFSPSFALSPSFSLSSSLSFHTLIRCDVSTSCSFYSQNSPIRFHLPRSSLPFLSSFPLPPVSPFTLLDLMIVALYRPHAGTGHVNSCVYLVLFSTFIYSFFCLLVQSRSLNIRGTCNSLFFSLPPYCDSSSDLGVI